MLHRVAAEHRAEPFTSTGVVWEPGDWAACVCGRTIALTTRRVWKHLPRKRVDGR